ncbi:preprotein translocase subunit SecG [Halobacteriovorax sp. JY17]|uniref:preprotein translocase subunit SecG n=1 Tax=Halobacteriovorax sp. JY17 TaxID=2014617 RepID=UPI000C54735C|nr:preprotein translocase subunit SecG [Halobacteriovorax sp. JY17]PIK13827.1 MAG: preprotein translocase subunit SecG [Halobacteriovorax sp. JY17]
MFHSLMIFHIVISVLLIVLVLLQFGKGAEAGLMSGGGGDSTFSGSQQGNILGKITTILAVLFLGNSILLAKIQSTKSSSSLLDGEAPVAAPLNNDAMMPKAQETTTPAAKTEEAKK